jgi:hypothetical protein
MVSYALYFGHSIPSDRSFQAVLPALGNAFTDVPILTISHRQSIFDQETKP